MSVILKPNRINLYFTFNIEMEAFIRTPFAVVLLATLGMCYPSGAPVNACESLMPNHGATSQPADTSPYQIILNDFHNPMGVLQYVPEVTYTG